MAAPSPLLDLRDNPRPAWLWDCDRHRIVWANRAALALFEAKSLFELVDRMFDATDPALERLASLRTTLSAGETVHENLDLPQLVADRTLIIEIALHDLADGRQGLKIIEAPVTVEIPADLSTQAYMKMPMAAALLAEDGTLIHPNLAAAALLPAGPKQLRELFADPARAERALQQLKTLNLLSTIEQMKGRLGLRDVRLSFQRLEEPGLIAVVNLEDITERRALEQQMAETAEPAPPVLSRTDAFDKLAKSLQDTMQSSDAKASTPKAEAEPAKPAARQAVRKEQEEQLPSPATKAQSAAEAIPATIRNAMERSGEAVVIARGNKVVFATAAAKAAYDLKDANNQAALLAHLAGLTGPVASTQLPAANGLQDVDVSVRAIPWQDGPATQYIIRKGKAPAAPFKAAASTAFVPEPLPEAEEKPQKPESDVRPHMEAPVPRPIVRVPSPSPQITMSRVSAPARTQHTASEAAAPNDELKAILDVASDGIITLDDAGNILSFSAGAEAIFGHAMETVIDCPMADLLAPESRKTWADYLAALQGPGLASVFNDGREVTALVKQGGTVPLFLTLGRLQSPKSKARFCAVVRDITPWKRTERELRDARDQAEAANRQKSIFLAHISHELRTPLNAIMGFSEVMQHEKFGALPSDKYRSYAHDIHASGKHLLSLIDDLLDLSRIEAGKLDLNFTEVNLDDVADHAIRMLQGEASARRVILRKSMPKDLPRVVADLRSMRQVMMNVLSNAIKFTESAGQVIVSAQLQPDGALVLRIKDTGIGMTEDQVAEALEPFKRIATKGRETQGTGLGLPLTKALVEANRAEFHIDSAPGAGTRVEIRFPTPRVLAD